MPNYIAGIEVKDARGDEDIIADDEFTSLAAARSWLVDKFYSALEESDVEELGEELENFQDAIDNHNFNSVDFFYTGTDELVYFILEN